MSNTLHVCLLISIVSTWAKKEELPLCPTNIQFFPQNLPMHCRMPAKADFPTFQLPDTPQFHTLAPALQPFYQSPPPEEQPKPIPIPIPPGIPGAMPFPGPVPMMPLPAPGPAQKLPVIVMPFYSPDPSFKRPPQVGRPRKPGIKKKKFRRPRYYSDTSSDTDTGTDTDTDTDTDISSDTSSDTSRDTSSDRGWWKNRIGRRSNDGNTHKKRSSKKSRRRTNRHKKLLTPVLQYVTKDGYVIFEKKISKDEAKEWLSVKTKDSDGDKENDTVLDKELHDLNQSENVDRRAEVEEVTNKPNKTREQLDSKTANQEVEEVTTQKLHSRKHRQRSRKAKSTRPQTTKTNSK